MSIRRTLANRAIEAAKRYARERLEEIKQLDLDRDGRKDVDQLADALNALGDKLRVAIESTDWAKLSAGAEQIVGGGGMIADAVDRHKVGAACMELIAAVRQAGKLLRLGVEEVKRIEPTAHRA